MNVTINTSRGPVRFHSVGSPIAGIPAKNTNDTVREVSPFEWELSAAMLRKVTELRDDGTAAMSLANFKQVVTPPSDRLEGAPRGTNARYFYNELFNRLARELSPVAAFLLN